MFDAEWAWSCLDTIDRLNRHRVWLLVEGAWLERDDTPPDDVRLVEIAEAVPWLERATEHLWRRLRGSFG